MVDLERLEDKVEITAVQNLIWQHAMYTGSNRAWKIVRSWDDLQRFFVKVIPLDYRRMLQSLADTSRSGLNGEEAVMAAFTANSKELARVSGN
jgi:glutamate synthase (ferredoxin)